MTPVIPKPRPRRAYSCLRRAILAIVLHLVWVMPLRAVELPVAPIAPLRGRLFGAPGRRDAVSQLPRFVPRFDLPEALVAGDTLAPPSVGLLPLPAPTAGPVRTLQILSDFPGIEFDDVNPPNPSISAGPAHVLGVTNGTVTIFRKDGTVVTQGTLTDFFQPVADTVDFITDPRTLFDSGRFLVSAAARRTTPFAAFFFLAVSDTADPTAGWHYYALNAATNNATPTTNFADLPSLGVDNNAVYLTANMFDAVTLAFQGAKIRVLPKPALLAGTSTSFVDFDNLQSGGMQVFHLQAAQSLGSSQAEFIVNTLFPSVCALTVWRVGNPPGGVPVLSQTSLPVGGDCLTPPNAEQPDTAERIETGGPRLINAVWRNNTLWTAAAVSHNWGSGPVSTVRLFQLATGSYPNVSVTQDILQGSDGLHTYYPVIAADGAGNALVGFNASSSSEYVSVHYAGQLASDPRNLPLSSQLLKPGVTTYVLLDDGNRNRWGDYNGIAVDPSTDAFWLMGEYAAAPSNTWGTWVGNLAFVTQTPTPTITGTPSRTPSGTPTAPPTRTPTITPIPSATRTPSSTRTPTVTATATQTPTQTPTETGPTRTPTITPTLTDTPTDTPTPTVTASDTPTPTETLAATRTPRDTRTPTLTPPPTRTPRDTHTPTVTPTATTVPTSTATDTPTDTPTPTLTPTLTPTPTPTPLPGDVNHDGAVNQLDIDLVIGAVFRAGVSANDAVDVNADGRVTGADVAAVVRQLRE